MASTCAYVNNFPLVASGGGAQGPLMYIWDFPLISRKVLELDSYIENTIRYCEVLALGTNISLLGGVKGA